jgi:AcrR family transcriptional regulator
VIEMLLEGRYPPPVDEIAKRSRVSVPSIFRYFDTLHELRQETIDRYFEQYADWFEIPALGRGPLADRIRLLVDARLDLYAATAGVARVARSQAEVDPVVARNLASRRKRSIDQLRAHLAPERAARTRARAEELVALIDVITSFEAWDLLVRTHGRSRRQIRTMWLDTLKPILSTTPSPAPPVRPGVSRA